MDTTTLLSPVGGIAYLATFAVVMLVITLLFGRRFGTKSVEGFLLANRRLKWWQCGPSIAASWTWAIALMVSVQMAYQNGLAGSFWFIAPNVAAVLIYVWLGPVLRRRLPAGFSLPEWTYDRFKDVRVVYLYLLVFGFYQVMAVTVQIYVGAHLFSAASGISPFVLMPTVLLITLAYAVISGMEASIITDYVQLYAMLFLGIGIVFLAARAAGMHMQFTGIAGGINPFAPRLALTTGVITSVGLLSGALGDQQLWQRSLAMAETHVRRGFVFAAVLFAAIPISLSFLGYVAASPEVGLSLPKGFDVSLVGFAVVKRLLPPAVAGLFLFVLLSGLASTLDSGLAAWTSLTELVTSKPWKTPGRRLLDSVRHRRASMLVVSAIGLLLAYAVELIPGFGLKYLWWFMNTMGTSIVVPTVLSLFWSRLTSKGIVLGSGLSLVFGVPLVGFASITANDYLLSGTYVGILAVTALSCIATASREGTVRV